MDIKDLNHFKQLVKENKIKDKWYFYKRTEEQKKNQANEMSWLILYFKNNLKLGLYPISGTLLGMIRDNDFIAHDNDVDLAYLSNKHTKQEVLDEFYQICEYLKKENLLARLCMKGQLHCFGKSKIFKYDIWTSFIINKKFYLVPLINGDLNEEVLIPFKKEKFRNNEFDIPNQSTKILDFIYKNWKQMDYKLGGKNKWKNIL